MRAEHLKLLLQDLTSVDLLAETATRLARAQTPADIAHGLARTRLTALRKTDGGVRGIATGDSFRHLVSRTLAKERAATFDRATPYQFALRRGLAQMPFGRARSRRPSTTPGRRAGVARRTQCV